MRRRGGWSCHLVLAWLGIAVLAAACDGQIGDAGASGVSGAGASGNGSSTGAGGAGAAGVGRNLRRLSVREYNNVVRDLLADTTKPANQFGQEVYTNGFDNGSDSLTVQGTDVLAFQAAAESLAATAVSNNLPNLIGGCDTTQPAQVCVSAFLDNFAMKAYRRPLTTTERQRLQTVYAAGAATGGFQGGIQLMLEAVLQSPSFLYREELGAPDPSLPKGVVRLTDYEVASELSFLLTGSMPDATLFTAAQTGTLKTVDGIRREATRLLASAQARPALRSFLHQWMATDQVVTINKDSTIYRASLPRWRRRWQESSTSISTRFSGRARLTPRAPDIAAIAPGRDARHDDLRCSLPGQRGAAHHARRSDEAGHPDASRVSRGALGRRQLGAGAAGRLRVEQHPLPASAVASAERSPRAARLRRHRRPPDDASALRDAPQPALLQFMPHHHRRRRLRLRRVRRDRSASHDREREPGGHERQPARHRRRRPLCRSIAACPEALRQQGGARLLRQTGLSIRHGAGGRHQQSGAARGDAGRF